MEEKYFLTAECTWENAADGTASKEQYLTVRVKDETGMPVTGLKKSDFKVYDSGFGFGERAIALVQEINAIGPSLPILPGTYRLKMTRHVYITGQFVYIVIVNRMSRGRKRRSIGTGQTLLSVVKTR